MGSGVQKSTVLLQVADKLSQNVVSSTLVHYQVYASFWSNDFWLSYGPWTLKFGQIFSCHLFFSLCLEILTWCLVYECIMMSYRSSLNFVLVQWFLAELWPLDFEIWPNIYCHHFITLWFEILTWFLVWVYNMHWDSNILLISPL
jgi:hypothetical protein